MFYVMPIVVYFLSLFCHFFNFLTQPHNLCSLWFIRILVCDLIISDLCIHLSDKVLSDSSQTISFSLQLCTKSIGSCFQLFIRCGVLSMNKSEDYDYYDISLHFKL